MYDGSLRAVSNRATYREVFEVADEDTGDLVDLTDAAIVFEIADRETGSIVLTASTGGGITITGTGAFEVYFSDGDMQRLCAGEYDVRCRVTPSGGDVVQLISGTLPVLAG